MQVSLEQDSKINNIRDSLTMNITMLSNTLADQSQTGTAVLSGINVFESCHTTIEGNCTIVAPTAPAWCLSSSMYNYTRNSSKSCKACVLRIISYSS